MFSRKKDKDRRASLASPPLAPQHHQADASRSSLASSTGSSAAAHNNGSSYRPSATSPDLAGDAFGGARARRSSFFGFGGGGNSLKSGHGGGVRDEPTGGGGLLGRTSSRFSTYDGEVANTGGLPPRNGRRDSSYGSSGSAAAGSAAGAPRGTPSSLAARDDYASSLGSSHRATPPPSHAPGAPASSSGSHSTASGKPSQALATQRSAAAAQEGLRHAINLLTAAQPEKVYHTSPPTVKSLPMYGVDGRHPKIGSPGTESNDWRETWLELRGVVLHSWDMKEVQEHNARGEDKHPTRTNITDAYVDLVPALPPTEFARSQGDTTPHRFVFSVNSAGLNSVLYSCETEAIRDAWVCAIRLAGWENARLQEVYTGHLIRASLTAPLPPQLSPAAPTIAGWFDVRTFGSRSWTHLWVVLSIASPAREAAERRQAAVQAQAEADAAAASSSKSRKRLSNMFSSSGGKDKDLAAATTPYLPPVPGDGSPTMAGSLTQQQQANGPLSTVPVVKASFYLAPPVGSAPDASSAGRRTSLSQPQPPSGGPPTKPVLVISDLHQAYAVFPETPAAVEASGMFKLEGAMAGDAVGASGRKRDEGWCLLIPGEKRGDEWVSGGKMEMIRWLTAFHDAFQLYGRPRHYSWDPRDPASLFFGHPGGASEADIFITKAPANPDEIATARPSFIRSRLRDLLAEKMGVATGVRAGAPPGPQGGQGPRKVSPQQQQQQSQRQPMQNGAGREVDRTLDYPNRDSMSTEGGRSSTPGSQTGRGVVGGGGGFQLPPLSFDEQPQSDQQRPPAQQQQQQQAPPLAPAMQSYPSATSSSLADTPKLPPAQSFQSPPTPKATMPLDTVRSAAPLPSNSEAPVISSATAATSPEYAYEVTPDARTPATEYSQSSAAPGQSSRQSTSGAPSVEEPEPLREKQIVQSDEGFDGYVPAHMIETGLTESYAPAQLNHQQQQKQQPPVMSPTSSSSHPSVRRKDMISLGRRPSGARAAPPRRVASGSTASMPAFSDEDEHDASGGARTPEQRSISMAPPTASPVHDTHAADALAALSFLEASASPDKAPRDLPAPPPTSSAISSSDEKRMSLPKLTTDFDGSGDATQARPQAQQFPSSFGPGKNASERRAKLEAAEQQRQEAMHKPGRGKAQAARKPSRTGGWQSSDEDDEDEADESSDDDERPAQHAAIRPLPQNPASLRPNQPPPAARPHSQVELQQQQRSELGTNGQSFGAGGSQARPASHFTVNNGGHTLPHATSRSNLQQVAQPQPRPGQLGGGSTAGGMSHSRSTMWNTHLEAPHGGLPAEQEHSGKFVTIEPSATLTKAFNPNGLLQAGLADRDERSAKRQEELARADGSSLINVPPPPPPPQMGLLGAITGYEAQRSREGGVGAALTERDRERREADERARKADNLQRSQMEQMSQQGGYGYPYGQPPQPGMMGGMMPWGMGWGMQPPMSQYGGFGGQMDPQAQMIAQQAAQMAYQQAMMAYSQAGSQMGGSQMQTSPSMGWPPAGAPGGGMPYWGGGMPTMSPPAAAPMSPMPFMPPSQSYPTSHTGSVFNGNGGGPGPEFAATGARHASPAPSRGRSPGQVQPQQQSQSSTPRSTSKANLAGN